MTGTASIILTMLVLFVVGLLRATVTARRIQTALEVSAQLVAVNLSASEAEMRSLLAEIRTLTNGRLDLALDKVTRLEQALARERGVDPPMPNPLATHADQPTTE